MANSSAVSCGTASTGIQVNEVEIKEIGERIERELGEWENDTTGLTVRLTSEKNEGSISVGYRWLAVAVP